MTQLLPPIGAVLPELVLAVSAIVLILIGAVRGEGAANFITGLAIAVLAAAGVLVLLGPGGETVAFNGSLVIDPFGRFMKALAIFGAMVALIMAVDWQNREKLARFEYAVLFVIATLGMCMLVSAGDLIALYLGLELMSFSLYVLAAINRDSVRSTEAGLKYFVLGSLSSGMLLYGSSLVYGFTGSVNFEVIATVVKEPSIGLIFGLVFVLAGLCFKISAVPFHMWTPDVYEGAPTPVTTFFATAPKVAGMAIFIRVVLEAFPHVAHQWQQIVVFVSIASMVLGAFAAIGQRNIKRLLAYSSIGHMGFALVGLAAGTAEGVRGVLVYIAIYVAMTLGSFACVLTMRRQGRAVENIDELAGLARNNPLMALMFGALMFSLAGVPPLAGFLAKYYVFVAAIQAGLYGLAVIGVLASVVGAYYYLRVVKVMYFDEPAEAFDPMPTELKAVLALSGLFTIFYFVYPAPLIEAAGVAARSLF
ncbi:NADH-quinone oxidoreductase subunit NuoN [Xanthobacter agilis]|jgi:NADH-quinone oxidoreductase subunit N|uniref:NADH-quinone oxidoreductase subunit N n=1 Tax=Xanthobacter agilis TaxID=47492 RepID=A0ABU0LIQ7_XANAG|nr:NADH-quinone oxidoreductase subunit NuoN [Xanthobacter agilis]MDQ0507027.1 NADH-quinone oxidoreductase subunit N [Xanthobacter agilis]